jgi:hypothetical protein
MSVVLSGHTDKDRLKQIARLVYDQVEKRGDGASHHQNGRPDYAALHSGYGH